MNHHHEWRVAWSFAGVLDSDREVEVLVFFGVGWEPMWRVVRQQTGKRGRVGIAGGEGVGIVQVQRE